MARGAGLESRLLSAPVEHPQRHAESVPSGGSGGRLLDPSHEQQDDKDDQNDADDPDAAVAISVSITAEAAAEAAEQKMMRMMTRISPSDMVVSFSFRD